MGVLESLTVPSDVVAISLRREQLLLLCRMAIRGATEGHVEGERAAEYFETVGVIAHLVDHTREPHKTLLQDALEQELHDRVPETRPPKD